MPVWPLYKVRLTCSDTITVLHVPSNQEFTITDFNSLLASLLYHLCRFQYPSGSLLSSTQVAYLLKENSVTVTMSILTALVYNTGLLPMKISLEHHPLLTSSFISIKLFSLDLVYFLQGAGLPLSISQIANGQQIKYNTDTDLILNQPYKQPSPSDKHPCSV